jgi:primosomal protein N' (replication factor Y)
MIQALMNIKKRQKNTNLIMNKKKALEYLDLVNNKFDVSVLQGTTGSGKTLVYFERIKKIIDNNKQGISFIARNFFN